MRRIYDYLVEEHLNSDDQMLFMVGPRQVGKTTISKNVLVRNVSSAYLNWDYEEDQQLILGGSTNLLNSKSLLKISEKKHILIFDEIHKFNNWRNYLKGIYDKYKEQISIIAISSTALCDQFETKISERACASVDDYVRKDESSKICSIKKVVRGCSLDAFKSVGNSLMGRYFLYRIHPLTLAEFSADKLQKTEIQFPSKPEAKLLDDLLKFGGFPDPFLKYSENFYHKWSKLRIEQLFDDEIRNLVRVNDINSLKLMANMLKHQAGQLVNYSSLASKLKVSVDSVISWIELLSAFYYCYKIHPWSRNLPRALIKQPKIYLWNWADVHDMGARRENMVAGHLKKFVDFMTDLGYGQYNLFFIRDKEQNEVDFLVTKNDEPWFLVEVKSSNANGISKSLIMMQKKTGAKHAFQLSFADEFVERDCFEYTNPVIVPASSFLSQLV